MKPVWSRMRRLKVQASSTADSMAGDGRRSLRGIGDRWRRLLRRRLLEGERDAAAVERRGLELDVEAALLVGERGADLGPVTLLDAVLLVVAHDEDAVRRLPAVAVVVVAVALAHRRLRGAAYSRQPRGACENKSRFAEIGLK